MKMKLLFAAAALVAGGTAIAQQRDARGIPVTSEQATAPQGANQPVPAGAQLVPAPNQSSVFTTQPATATYPPCERGQTDRCTQTYEGRGSGTARRSHRRRR
jgi:hypothetical protein